MHLCSSLAKCSRVMARLYGAFLVFCVFGAALTSSVRIKRELIDDKVQSYLMKFGYIPRTRDGAFALRTEESVRSALADLQKFAGIPATGHLDEATVKLLLRPRCGLPDKVQQTSGRRKRFTLQGEKWPYTNLTWSLRSRNLRDLDTYEVRLMISKAFEVWSRHSKLTFTEVDSDRADILIYFYSRDHGDHYAFDGKGVVLAHAFFPNGGKSIEVHFDADESWTTSSDPNVEGTNFFNVAAHEFGHSLGLAHSSVDTALMYPWYKEIEANGYDFDLPDDDRMAIQTLYGAKEDRLWGKINTYRPPTPPTTTTTTTTLPPPRTSRYYPPKPPNKPYPYDPRYPNGKHPENPYPNYPYRPSKSPHHPKKPMHPDKKPHYHPKPPPTFAPTFRPATQPAYYPKTGWNYPDKESPPLKPIPETCDTSYDSVAVMRREVFIFKDAYFWRIGDKGLMKGYPAEITRLWRALPENLTHVDAVYERPDSKIVFFIGKLFYVFTGNKLDSGYPRPITDLGFPESLERIDGAMVWGHNGKTYFYSGSYYWRLNDDNQRVEYDYPRDISTTWTGVESNIDAVFQWKDGKTYFFKGKGFWKFNDQRMRVENEEQKLSAPFWMGCTNNLEGREYLKEAYISKSRSNNIPSTLVISIMISILFVSQKLHGNTL